ncbi:T53G5 protein, partial [Penelope pileata]|nr:T53G5 protein [Penelope pileata]
QALKELSLLRLLKRTNRRVLRLHALALRCWRSLTARGPPAVLSVPPGKCHHVPEPEDAARSPDASSTCSGDALTDPEVGTPPGDPQPLPACWEDEQELLSTLPRRFHRPAPKVLCRPSAQRWVKPRCTRSCGESLEHVLTIHYPQ